MAGLDESFNFSKNHVSKYAFATRGGYQPHNPRKVNQDTFVLAPNLLDQNSLHMFGICDGHGSYGHLVSAFIKEHLPRQLVHFIAPKNLTIREALANSFTTIHKGISLCKDFDSTLSGSTCVMMVTHGSKIYTANAGDSRAILVS